MKALGFWQWVAIVLALWVIYDLVMGYTYSYRLHERSKEPVLYWLFVVLWAAVAAGCWFWG